MNKSKLILTILGLVTLFLASIAIFYIFVIGPKNNENKIKLSDYEYDLNKEIKEKFSYTEEQLSEMTLKEKEIMMLDDDEFYKQYQDRITVSDLDKGVKKLEDYKIKEYEDKYITYLTSKDYLAIINEYEQLRQKYILTDENGDDLRNIYEGATIMYNLQNAHDESVMENFISSFKEPRTFLISVMSFPEKYRRAAFLSTDSLSPDVPVDIFISNYRKLAENSENIIENNDIVTEFYKSFTENNSLYLFEINIGNEHVLAYVAQNNKYKDCKIYKITTKNNSKTSLKTVKELQATEIS